MTSSNPHVVTKDVEYLSTTAPYMAGTGMSSACWSANLSHIALSNNRGGSVSFTVTCPAPPNTHTIQTWYEVWRGFRVGNDVYNTYDAVKSDQGQHEWLTNDNLFWWQTGPGEFVYGPNPVLPPTKSAADDWLAQYFFHNPIDAHTYNSGIVGPLHQEFDSHPPYGMTVSAGTFKGVTKKNAGTAVDGLDIGCRTDQTRGVFPGPGIISMSVDLKTLKLTGSFSGNGWLDGAVGPPE